MLGDLTAEKPGINSNTRLQFKQSIKNKLYIEHLYSLFQEFCGSKPLILSNFDSRANKMKEYTAIKFQTLSLPCFNKYRELFYNSAFAPGAGHAACFAVFFILFFWPGLRGRRREKKKRHDEKRREGVKIIPQNLLTENLLTAKSLAY